MVTDTITMCTEHNHQESLENKTDSESEEQVVILTDLVQVVVVHQVKQPVIRYATPFLDKLIAPPDFYPIA